MPCPRGGCFTSASGSSWCVVRAGVACLCTALLLGWHSHRILWHCEKIAICQATRNSLHAANSPHILLTCSQIGTRLALVSMTPERPHSPSRSSNPGSTQHLPSGDLMVPIVTSSWPLDNEYHVLPRVGATFATAAGDAVSRLNRISTSQVATSPRVSSRPPPLTTRVVQRGVQVRAVHEWMACFVGHARGWPHMHERDIQLRFVSFVGTE